ncbi:putative Inositol polyphosphate 5-phosphatase E [Blattamonas nauphoetae]|uniref:Inositol polyphosphate 5-phosphatase E n=1 Tax=Blattamonas nauphoetae TaxID=2049346 RepID=A0ABQ9YKC3_9EUKA|nr:putative Inositol polyphosphate 5-phosphatase E [Blattamonas nauphoetae]
MQTTLNQSHDLTVYVCTWNLEGGVPPQDMLSFIPIGEFDIFAIGTEECERTIAKSFFNSKKEKWEAVLEAFFTPNDYCLVETSTLMACHIAVYIRSSLRPHLSCVQRNKVATGFGQVIGNKGAVMVAFCLFERPFLFISSHFEANQHSIQERNMNYLRIQTETDINYCKHCLPRDSAEPDDEIMTNHFDYVWWMGDFNYRIDGTVEMILQLMKRGEYGILSLHDQLYVERKAGNVFQHGFCEGPLLFKPTYKIQPYSNPPDYGQMSKKRIPSWTDRIFWRPSQRKETDRVALLKYNAAWTATLSDHRPVFCLFHIVC